MGFPGWVSVEEIVGFHDVAHLKDVVDYYHSHDQPGAGRDDIEGKLSNCSCV